MVNLPTLLARMALLDLRAGRAGTPRRTCGSAPGSPCGPAAPRSTWTAAGTCAPRPGARPRPSRCGPRMPRSCRARGTEALGTRGAGKNRCAQARRVLGPGQARAAEDRGAAMGWATAAEYALMLTGPGQPPRRPDQGWEAQRPGTGTGHPGRPGPHRCPDRRPAGHRRPHSRHAPGPDPGQDRLPPPRRPDPASSAGRPRLTWTKAGSWGISAPSPHRVKSTAHEVPLAGSFSVGLFPNRAVLFPRTLLSSDDHFG